MKRDAFNLCLKLSLTCLVLLLGGCATLKDMKLEDILKPGSGPLDEGTVAAGLKEALRVGTERSVLNVSDLDGYLANELIRIAVPEDMRTVTDKLRQVGWKREMIREGNLGTHLTTGRGHFLRNHVAPILAQAKPEAEASTGPR